MSAKKYLQPIECAHCGKEFQPKTGVQRFCSRECGYAYRRKGWKGYSTPIVCLQCGEEFNPGGPGSKFCSRVCQHAFKRKADWEGRAKDVACAHCGAAFRPRSATSKYCGVACQRAARRVPRLSTPPLKKRCPKCNRVRSASKFGRANTTPSGLQCWCKDCQTERRRLREYTHYQCAVCSKLFRRVKGGPKLEAERSQRCGTCAREAELAKHGGHSYNYNGSKHFAGKKLASWRHSARRRGYKWDLTREQLDAMFDEQAGVCALSGLRMIHKHKDLRFPSLDRIDPELGYEEGNVQFVCAIVNVMKSKLLEEDFVWLCAQIVQHRPDLLEEAA